MGIFTDKVVWITGASSGIGEAFAHSFSKEGALLILSARREDELSRVKKTIPKAEILPLDLEKWDTLEIKTVEARAFYDKIDIIIHAAGISQRSLAENTNLSVDKKIMDINYFGPIALTKFLLPSMKAKKSGQIIIISSLLGKFGTPYRSAYSASKHALHGFFDSLRAEVAKYKISVTTICPGYVKTNISINALDGIGNAYSKLDSGQENAMSALEFVNKAMSVIKNKKPEAIIGGKEVFGTYIKRLSPSLLFKLMEKAKVL